MNKNPTEIYCQLIAVYDMHVRVRVRISEKQDAGIGLVQCKENISLGPKTTEKQKILPMDFSFQLFEL